MGILRGAGEGKVVYIAGRNYGHGLVHGDSPGPAWCRRGGGLRRRPPGGLRDGRPGHGGLPPGPAPASRTSRRRSSIEDIQKKIQLEALTESPLQQAIRDIQVKQLDELLKMNKSLEQYVNTDLLAPLRNGR
jgi:hypothetical protein